MENNSDDVSYYATLNIPRTATDDEIKRAYRALAQVYHPDKHQGDDKQSEASQVFKKIVEAYEVLSDPVKRDLYDVYGKEGLMAGLEVGPHLDKEQLKAQWEAFRKRADQSEVLGTSYHGRYSFNVDAGRLVAPYVYRHVYSRIPTVRAVSMTNSMQAQVTQRDSGFIGGEVLLRDGRGEGGFVCGYRRAISQYDTLDLQATLGLKSLVACTISRQLTDNDSAGISLSWQPQVGPALEVVSMRQLSQRYSGEFRWQLGRLDVSAMSLSVKRRGRGNSVEGKISVGANTGISATIKKAISSTLFGIARLTVYLPAAWEADMGVQQLAGSQVLGMYVNVGWRGVHLRLRLSKGGQTFEFPILLCPRLESWVVLAACLAPPLLIGCARWCVIDPLLHWLEGWRDQEQRAERLGEISRAMEAARKAQELLLPVATRKMQKEAALGGLVVVHAEYGVLSDRAAQQERAATAAEEVGPSSSTESGTASSRPSSVAASSPCIDVTVPCQFMVDNGTFRLHAGIPLSGLMGFCDPSPGHAKQLRVWYWCKAGFFESVVGDGSALSLPQEAGVRISDAKKQAEFLSYAKAQDVSLPLDR